MKKFGKKLMVLTAVTVCLAMVLTGCGAEEVAVEQEELSVAVTTQAVSTGTLTLSNAFVGTISPEETVAVVPLAAGTVTETFFEVGDYVEAGDVLFKIDDEIAQIQATTAALSVQQAEQSAEMTLGSQQDAQNLQLESAKLQAKTAYESAQIGYVQAKDTLKDVESAADDARSYANSLKKAYENAEKAYKDAQSVSGNDIGTLEQNMKAAKAAYEKADEAADTAESAQYKAQMAYYSAKSGYKAAEKGMETAEQSAELTQGDILADTEAQLMTGLELAALQAESAEIALSYYTVKAPVSGIIESKNVDVNGMASQASPAYTIVNNDTMTVTFNVSEKVKNTLEIGQSITLDRSGAVYEATITEIGASINQMTGLFEVKGCVSANGKELPSGVSVKIVADTYKAENAMLIPYDSVYYDNDGAYVYCNVENRAKKVFIETGIFDEERIEVISGLSIDDIVVTSWSPKLADGVLLADVTEEN
ncbi:MAG: efflux RND transporter periplasmic adaptor subunit [Lachnospiraceae bacterium]|nr:efflux RND transporter periplasmic adaptor subunit [Lachnospiraceae bacterium]